jgi:hypothetical protein
VEEDQLQTYQWFVELFPEHQFTAQVWDLINQRRQEVLWNRTRLQKTRNAYWNYMKRYPNGGHVTEARSALGQLSAPLRFSSTWS